MNFDEACAILEISSTATPEEAKKKYRQLTKKHHPDVNKSEGSEDKFKKINEAYRIFGAGKDQPLDNDAGFNWGNAYNPFSKINHNLKPAEHIALNHEISFKDSILGCKIDLKFKRNIKCKDCNGNGSVTLNNGCDKCNGLGQVTKRQGNMIFVSTCDKCYGKHNKENCKTCIGSGLLDADTDISVSVPGGIQTGNILRLNGMGNFAGNFGPMDQYTDAHLQLKITPDSDLTFDGTNVIFNLKLSLLDAIKGCKKNVKTLLGDKEIEIKPSSKNKEEIIIPNVGVNSIGNQNVILNVLYPNNLDKLIEVLSEEVK